MGIMDYFRVYANFKKSLLEEKEEEVEDIVQEEFVPDISMYELDKVNWVKFAGRLKANGVLPNSYVKKPAGIDVFVDNNNRPMISLTFNSATSDSVRDYLLLQDGVYEYVNGKLRRATNEKLIELWESLQNQIRLGNKIETNRQGYLHKVRGMEMMQKAQKLLSMDDIYEREQEFLESYKDTRFCDIASGYCGSAPEFIPLVRDEDGKWVDGEGVVPFSPKTLEMCILNMTKEGARKQAVHVRDFEDVCNEFKEYSCYESDAWDKVIELGKKVIRSKAICSERDYYKGQ